MALVLRIQFGNLASLGRRLSLRLAGVVDGNQIVKIKVSNSFIFENGADVGRQFYYVSKERMQLFNNAVKSVK